MKIQRSWGRSSSAPTARGIRGGADAHQGDATQGREDHPPGRDRNTGWSWQAGTTAYQPAYARSGPPRRRSRVRKIADTLTRTWHITRWSGGEGDDLWDPSSNRYDTSQNVVPITIGEGLVLASYNQMTLNVATATFAEGLRLGISLGNLYAVKDDTLHPMAVGHLQLADGGTATGAGGAEACSICDAGMGPTSTSPISLPTLSARWPRAAPTRSTTPPALHLRPGDRNLRIPALRPGRRRPLGGDRGQRPDPGGRDRLLWQRLPDRRLPPDLPAPLRHDVGLVWYTVSDNGQVYLWEYNVPDDLDSRIGKLPVDGCYPYSIAWANGYVFVAFRYASGPRPEG